MSKKIQFISSFFISITLLACGNTKESQKQNKRSQATVNTTNLDDENKVAEELNFNINSHIRGGHFTGRPIQIRHLTTGKCLKTTNNGKTVYATHSCSASSRQAKWRILTISQGAYKIQSVFNPSKCLLPKVNGLELSQCDSSFFKRWYIQHNTENDGYQLIHTNLHLQNAGPGCLGAYSRSWKALTRSCKTSDRSQNWRFYLSP